LGEGINVMWPRVYDGGWPSNGNRGEKKGSKGHEGKKNGRTKRAEIWLVGQDRAERNAMFN
jgi:hypothetical protein